MTVPEDPFRHHPELRGEIKPAADSFFRDLDLEELDRRVIAAGQPTDWRTPCREREAQRKSWLAGHLERDLWVFGYGSLMWDPAMEFTEVRRAYTADHGRSFCLWDDGARGSIAFPGLMLALDEGPGCVGLAFRIPAAKVDHETFVLFRREMITTGYRPIWLRLGTAQGDIDAITFLADRDEDHIHPDIPLPEQASRIARAEGMIGSNFDYLQSTLAHLDLLKIEDPYIRELHAATVRLRAG